MTSNRNYPSCMRSEMRYFKVSFLKNILLVSILSSLILACQFFSTHPNLGGQPWRHLQEDNLAEAIFRWQITEHRTDETCYLAINNHAPSSKFMQRFVHLPFVHPKVGPMQMGILNGKYGFVDRKMDKFALLFWIDRITWVSDGQAFVSGGGAAAVESGNHGTFKVIWNEHQWEVQDYIIKAMH